MSNEIENREPESSTDILDSTDEAVIAVDEASVIEDTDESGAGNDAAAAALSGDDLSDDEGDDGIVDADDESAPVILAGKPADAQQLQRIVEGALMAAGKPLSVSDLGELFETDDRPSSEEIRMALTAITEQCAGRGFELREVASGFRFQVVQEVAPWVGRLWDEKPQRYSRALLETLALIAYRQPITRGDIENIRGVAVASNIVKTLLEREWVRVVGHKDVPGRPAMYATTRKFLDYFNLSNLDDLPPLAELRDLDSLNAELALEGADTVIEEDGAVENNVVPLAGRETDAPVADTGSDSPAGDSPAEKPAPTLASLAAGLDTREPEASPEIEAPVAETGGADAPAGNGGASDFAPIFAALRARDQHGGAGEQDSTVGAATDEDAELLPAVDKESAVTGEGIVSETDDDESEPKRDA